MDHDDAHKDSSPLGAFWGAWNLPMAAAFWQTGEAYSRACFTWQQELERFMRARFEENRDLQHALSNCRTIGDVAKLQQEWAMTAAKAYLDEAGRLAQIFSTLTQGGQPPKQEPASVHVLRR